jgi:hypothetical protein
MNSTNRIVEASIWILLALVCLSGSAIIIHRVPSFPILLVFVFLFETFLVANMLISIRRINRSIEPRTRYQSRGLAPVNLVDIEDEG